MFAPFRSLEISIALRYMGSRRRSRLLSLVSVIAMGGIIVGVSALIVIIGVMSGLQNELREKILIGTADIRVLTYGEDLSMSNWRSTLALVKRQPGVVAAAPFVHTQALMNARQANTKGTFVLGIEPDRPGTVPVTSVRTTARSGDFSFRTSSGDTNGVVVGARIADRLQLHAGTDSVLLISANLSRLDPVTGQPLPSQEKFQVTGIFETGMYEYDNAYVFMALPTAQRFAQLGASVTGIEVRTSSRDVAPRIALALSDSLRFPYRTEDWQAQNSSFFKGLQLQKVGMALVLVLIVLVAAFNVVSTLTMVVNDKKREIGILRAMGMQARSIGRIFFAQGVVIGLLGTSIGLLLGLAASVAVGHYKLISLDPSVYVIDHLPVATEPGDISVIVVACLFITALATLYPARQAARAYPVDAIRHE